MNEHRMLKKSKLINMLATKEKIRRKALDTCRLIMPLIDPELTELVEMDIASAAAAMDELVMQQAELLSLSSKITQLEEALYS